MIPLSIISVYSSVSHVILMSFCYYHDYSSSFSSPLMQECSRSFFGPFWCYSGVLPCYSGTFYSIPVYDTWYFSLELLHVVKGTNFINCCSDWKRYYCVSLLQKGFIFLEPPPPPPPLPKIPVELITLKSLSLPLFLYTGLSNSLL